MYNPPATTHRDHFERGCGGVLAISLPAAATEGEDLPGALQDAPLHLDRPVQYAPVSSIARASARQEGGLSVKSLCLELLGSLGHGHRAETPPPWLARALELLDDRYTDSLGIGEIAASVCVHPIHLARTFRRHFRCSPGDYQRFRRVQHAASLLGRTHLPLSEVALAAGFGDQSHLTRAFSHHFGLPPGEYRRLAS